jgi:4-carboxymuconolactone decarboxylase
MLTAINRSDELKGHINGALNNGATPDEIAEVFLHASAYLGWPASGTSLRIAVEVFKERGLV